MEILVIHIHYNLKFFDLKLNEMNFYPVTSYGEIAVTVPGIIMPW